MTAVKHLMNVISDDELLDELIELQEAQVNEYYEGFHNDLQSLELTGIANQMKFEYLCKVFHKYSLEQLETCLGE